MEATLTQQCRVEDDGLLCATPLLLPFYELLQISRRADSAFGLALPAKQLMTLFIPDYFGNPANYGAYWGDFNYSEWTNYVGIVALTLAIAAPLVVRRFRPIYLVALSITLIYIVAGGPGSDVLWTLPLIKQISRWRLLFILPLPVALLGAETLRALQDHRPLAVTVASGLVLALVGGGIMLNVGLGRQNFPAIRFDVLIMVVFLVALNGLLWLTYWRKNLRPLVMGAVTMLIFADLYQWGANFNPVGPIAELDFTHPSVTAIQEADKDGYRTVALQSESMIYGLNTLNMLGVAEPGGYSSFLVRPLFRLIGVGDPVNVFGNPRTSYFTLFTAPSPRLLELLQVRRLVTSEPAPRTTLAGGNWEVRTFAPLTLYELKMPPPRAAVVYQTEVIGDEEAAIERLLSPEFKLGQVAVVPYPLAMANSSESASPATIISETSTRFEIEATSTRTGLLTLGEVYYPGWQATVDGEPAEVIQSNLIWRGVVVPPGQHRIIFELAPPRLYWGIVIGAVATILCLFLLVVDYGRNKQKGRYDIAVKK